MHTAQHVNVHEKFQFHVCVAMATKIGLKVKQDVSVVSLLLLLIFVITFELCNALNDYAELVNAMFERF